MLNLCNNYPAYLPHRDWSSQVRFWGPSNFLTPTKTPFSSVLLFFFIQLQGMDDLLKPLYCLDGATYSIGPAEAISLSWSRNSFSGSFICVHGLNTHLKQSRPVKDNIEEVTYISSLAAYVIAVWWSFSIPVISAD